MRETLTTDIKDIVGSFFRGKNPEEILSIPVSKGNDRGIAKDYLRRWRISRSCRGRTPLNKGIPHSGETEEKWKI